MRALTSLRRLPRLELVTAVVAVAGIVVAVALAAESAIKTTTPKSADQITNIDVLRQQIRNYYGDPLGTGTFTDDSNYANEARSVAESGTHWLDARATPNKPSGEKAIVLDVDDTTLAT